MIHIPVTALTLPGALRRGVATIKKAIRQGARTGAKRGMMLLRQRTPVDQGHMRAAWDVVSPLAADADELVRIVNDHPMIGVAERGARPHPVSHAGVVALWEWVWRHRANFGLVSKSGKAKRGLDAQKETLRIARAIAKKIAQRGQKPTYFIRDSLEEIQRFIIEAAIEAAARAQVR